MKFNKRIGWFNESYRHSLAARGISTSKRISLAGRFDVNTDTDAKWKQDQYKHKQRSRKINFGDENINWNKLTPEQQADFIRDKMRLEANQAALEKTRMDVENSNTRFAGPSGTAAKLDAEADYKRTALKQLRNEFVEAGDLAKAGRFDMINGLDSQRANSQELVYIKDAMAAGVGVQLSQGQPIDIKQLKSWGFTDGEIRAINEKMATNPMYKWKFRNRVATEKLKDVAEGAESLVTEKAPAFIGKAAGSSATAATSALGQLGSVGGSVIDTSKDERVHNALWGDGNEVNLDKEKGSMGFWKIAGLDQNVQNAEKKRVTEEKAFSVANRADRETSSFFNNLADLKLVDFSAYDKGEMAYKTGDLEGLRKSIRDLQSEKMKVNDKLTLISHIRRVVLSDQNVFQTTLKENVAKDGGFSGISNPLMGGDPGAKLNDQVNKVSRVSRDLQKKSDMLSQRISLLNQKYNRIAPKATIDPQDPGQVKVIDNNGVGLGGMFEWQ